MSSAHHELLREDACSRCPRAKGFFRELFGRSNGQGWVEQSRRNWDLPDPDQLEDSLKILSIYTDTYFDAFWHHIVLIDPDEVLRTRKFQKMQLARYGRQSIFDWDDVEVSELREWWDVLKEILESESPLASTIEE